MATQSGEFYALTSSPIPSGLHGRDSECAIRLLSLQERLQIEDGIMQSGSRIRLNEGCTAVVLSRPIIRDDSIEEFAILVEFALALLTVSGFLAINIAAVLKGTSVTTVLHRGFRNGPPTPSKFIGSITSAAAVAWLRRYFDAYGNLRGRMHITADRFVRYVRAQYLRDSLMDLCISLESLLDSQTEVSFRFGTCLAKVTGQSGQRAEVTAGLLSDLYDLRSKIVHGTDPKKELKKIESHLPELHEIARIILTKYVLFMSEYSRADWRQHLNALLFA